MMNSTPQDHIPGEQNAATDRTASGPSSAPAEYRFEPELCGLPPRPIPELVRQGHFDRWRQTAAWLTFTLGTACLVIWALPIWQRWAQRFPPLQYLLGISAAFLMLWAWHVLRRQLVLKPYRYVQDGVPLVARVVELVRSPVQRRNDEPTAYAFTALIEYVDPQTGERCQATMQSRQFTSSRAYTTSFKVGDYVTAVYLPGAPQKSLRLYAFLDLNPSVGLVRRPEDLHAGRRWASGALTALGILALFAVLFWNLYAFHCYLPMKMSFGQVLWPLALGGILLGGASIAGLVANHRRRLRLREQANRDALASGEALEMGHLGAWDRPGLSGWGLRAILVAGCLLMGGLTGLCWAMSANAILDDSPPQAMPVVVQSVRSNRGLPRHYVIKFSLPGSNELHDFNSVTQDLGEVRLGPATAQLHAGKLGWPWIKAIRSPAAGAAANPPQAQPAPANQGKR